MRMLKIIQNIGPNVLIGEMDVFNALSYYLHVRPQGLSLVGFKFMCNYYIAKLLNACLWAFLYYVPYLRYFPPFCTGHWNTSKI